MTGPRPVGFEPIRSARLDLVSMSPALLEALLTGRRADAERLLGVALPREWPGDILHAANLRRDQMRADPAVQPWLLRAMVLREPSPVAVGSINFHQAPDAQGRVEIGYSTLEPYRRRGFAREAVLAYFGWARDHGARTFVASVSPDNGPSLALIRSLGFEQTGEQWDDIDGLELVFEVDASNVNGLA